MARVQREIEKRRAAEKPKFKDVRLPIKKKTAENILKMNAIVSQKQAELQQAIEQMQNHILPLITEAGLENGRVVQVTEAPPYELVIQVPK